jgi:hypothetical protein
MLGILALTNPAVMVNGCADLLMQLAASWCSSCLVLCHPRTHSTALLNPHYRQHTFLVQGHEDSVHAAVISNDERLLATASYDCTVRVWDLTTGDCLKVLQHTDPVMRVAFSPAVAAAIGSQPTSAGGMPATAPARLVTACEGRALWLWDVESGACIAALGEHKEAVTCAVFSPDGAWLASTSQDRSVLVWDAATGRLAGLYVGDAAMLCCCFAVRGADAAAGQASKRLQLSPDKQQQQQEETEEDSAQADAAAAAAGAGEPGSRNSRSSISRSKTDEALIVPRPGGLTLLVGDASGCVHFIDCL